MDKKSPSYIVCFVTVICLIFGLGISVVHNVTTDMLKRNESLHRNRVLCDAFMFDVEKSPEAYELAVAEKLEFKDLPDGDSFREAYMLLGSEDKIMGFKFSGIGFWDRIIGVVVLSQDLNRIINLRFFEQKETPGLGARIEENWFTDQFKGVIPAWDEPVSNRIIIKAASGSQDQNQIDGIAGATQTSMALKRILNSELELIRNLVFSEGLIDE